MPRNYVLLDLHLDRTTHSCLLLRLWGVEGLGLGWGIIDTWQGWDPQAYGEK
ncbi:hypothetical protein Hanom_Chr04g00314121 [Helianthus anomalus]